MSTHTFTISDKKLGFTLDKTKSTPTIAKITSGGALERLLIDSCSSISSGCEVRYVGGEYVKDLPFNEAMEKIKSYVERPINIVITSPRKSDIRQSYVSTGQAFKMSVKEMDKASEEATKQGLRDLAKAHKEKLLLEESSSDSSDEGEDYVSTRKYEELEKKNHFLKMELLNAQVDNEDQTNLFKKDLNPIKSLNDQLCHIISMKKRIDKIDKLNEIKNTSSEEMTRQIEKMNVESTSYFEECEKHLKLVEFHEIKNCVADFLEKEKNEMEKLNENYNHKIYRGQLYELAQLISLDLLLIGVLVGMIMILDKYYPIYN